MDWVNFEERMYLRGMGGKNREGEFVIV